MPPRIATGELRWRIALEKRAPASDGAGNLEGEFAEQFRRWARVTPLRGGEEVMAARLQGVQPVLIRVRRDSLTRTVAPGWRVRDVLHEAFYRVKAISNADEKDIYLDILCESGSPA